jgi:hypothetical protein
VKLIPGGKVGENPMPMSAPFSKRPILSRVQRKLDACAENVVHVYVRNLKQGCQIIHGTTYQNGEKYIKLPQITTKQMAVK